MKQIFGTLLAVTLLMLGAVSVGASHAWSKYHWDLSTADTEANPLKLGDNLTTTDWNAHLAVASADWNQSVLKNQVVPGQTNSSCAPTSGRVEVCNGQYGSNGWLGIAQVWVKRGRSGHITQSVVQLNDTYFNTPGYDSDPWRLTVMCQEVGHAFGLNHQDEDSTNANLGSCMDYTNDPDGSLGNQPGNEHPNAHDYEMLETIYAHLNSTSDDGGGGGGGGKGGGNGKGGGKKKSSDAAVDVDLRDPSAWGQAVAHDAQSKNSVYERELGGGVVLITHVLWVD